MTTTDHPRTTWPVRCEHCRRIAICNVLHGHQLICPACTGSVVTGSVVLADGTTGRIVGTTTEEGVSVLIVAGTGEHEGELHFVTPDQLRPSTTEA